MLKPSPTGLHLRAFLKGPIRWVIILAGVVVSLVVVSLDRFRLGSLMLAASLVLAFVLRLVLPSHRAGMLAVRSKTVDLVVLGVLAAALAVLALWVPPPA